MIIEPEAQEVAESITLEQTDLPAGWEPGKPVGLIWTCDAGDYSELTMTGTATGEELEHLAVGRATSRAQVYATEQMAAEALDILADQLEREEIGNCMLDVLVQDPEGRRFQAQIREIEISAPAGVDEARAWQAEITSDDDEIRQYEEMVALRAGERIAFVITSRVPTPLSPAVRDVLVAPVGESLTD